MSDDLNPQKHSAIIKISPLLAEIYEKSLTEQLMRDTAIFGKLKREWTPEEKERIETAKAKREKERKDLLDLLATATGVVKAIIELHSENKYEECEGCDLGSYAESGAQWPCRTIDLIAEELRGKD